MSWPEAVFYSVLVLASVPVLILTIGLIIAVIAAWKDDQ